MAVAHPEENKHTHTLILTASMDIHSVHENQRHCDTCLHTHTSTHTQTLRQSDRQLCNSSLRLDVVRYSSLYESGVAQ